MSRTNLQTIERTSFVLAQDTPEGRAELPTLLDPDFELIEADGLPYGGVYKGADGWWTAWREINATWTDFGWDFLGILGDPMGSDFAFLVNIRGKSVATGKPFETSLVEHWRMRNGKVLSIKPHYFDTKYLADVNTPS